MTDELLAKIRRELDAMKFKGEWKTIQFETEEDDLSKAREKKARKELAASVARGDSADRRFELSKAWLKTLGIEVP